jgi:lipopolysaccharide export system protein LptA
MIMIHTFQINFLHSIKKNIFFLFIAFFFCGIANSQESKPVFLKHADSLKGMTIGEEQIRELIGNVEIVQDNVILKCDRARQFFSSNKIEVMGHVVILQDTLKLYTESGIYYTNKKFAETFQSIKLQDGHTTLKARNGTYDAEQQLAFFYKDVQVEDTSNIILCDTLKYYRTKKIINANGHVNLLTRDNKAVIMGDSLIHEQDTRFTKVFPRAFLVQIDTVLIKNSDTTKADSIRIDSLFLKSHILEMNKDSGKSVIKAIDSVILFRDKLSAKCQYLTYLTDDSTFIFMNTPVLWYEDNQVTGDTILAFIKNKTLSSLLSRGNSFALSKPDTIGKNQYNQIEGQYLRIVFKDRKIDSVVAENQSMALYYLIDNTKQNGINKTSGDKIIMLFDGGKIKDVKVMSGIEGSYFPDKMVKSREADYNLPKFKVIDARPLRKDF